MEHPRTVGKQGWTIWFTGLSGAGKSTLANALASYFDRVRLPREVLDGDEVRRELCSDLGFSKQERNENVRRISYLARLLNRHGINVIVAAISPYRAARQEARAKSSAFVEIHVDCPLSTLILRDSKGLYKRALSGEINSFSGISDPYEAPKNPEIYVNSGVQPEGESVAIVLDRLRELGCLPNAKPRLRVAGAHA